MTDSKLNDMRLCKGIKAEAYSDCTRFVIQKDGTIKRKCFIMLAVDENDPEMTTYLEVGKNALRTIIKNLTDDLLLIEKEES